MAEFLCQPKPKKSNHGPDSGFDAFGKFVPPERRNAAYVQAKMMGITDNEQAWRLVNSMTEQIGRDQPYEAINAGMVYLDLTGTYRLMAYLCTGE